MESKNKTLADASGNYEFVLDIFSVWDILETQPNGFIDGKEASAAPFGTTDADQFL